MCSIDEDLLDAIRSSRSSSDYDSTSSSGIGEPFDKILDLIYEISYEQPIINNAFLICSNDFDGDTLKIICRHIQELGEFLYTKDIQLIARQEHNLDFCIYVAPFEAEANHDEAMKLIDDFVKRKREEEENNKNYDLPTERIIPELKLLNQKIDEMKNHHQNLIELHIQMHCDLYISGMNEIELLKQLEERKLEMGVLLEKSKYFQRSEAEQKSGWSKFYDQTDFSLIRENPILMKSVSHVVKMTTDGQNKLTIDEIVGKLAALLDVLQTNMNDMSKFIQEKELLELFISDTIAEYIGFLKSNEIPEILKKYKEEFGVKEVLGTVHFMPITYQNKQHHLCLVICEHKIIACNMKETEKECLYSIAKLSSPYNNYIKYATRVNLPFLSRLHANFVETHNDKVYEDHERVVKFIQNNFKCIEHGFNDTLVLDGIINLYNIFHHSFQQAM